MKLGTMSNPPTTCSPWHYLPGPMDGDEEKTTCPLRGTHRLQRKIYDAWINGDADIRYITAEGDAIEDLSLDETGRFEVADDYYAGRIVAVEKRTDDDEGGE